MKTKSLLFSFAILLGSFVSAQFSTGTASLGSSGMTINLTTNATTVTMILSGPSTNYLAVNFVDDGNGMQPGSDGFIYNAASTTDYSFSGIGATPSADASQDWTIVSNNVAGTTRTITATRSLSGGTGDYAFSNTSGSLPVAWSRGSDLNLAYHATRGYTPLTMAGTLSVDDLDQTKLFSISQNPVEDRLYFKNIDKVNSFKIYDPNGRLISETKEIATSMDASFLQSGVYYMEVRTKEGNILYQKIIKK